MDLKNKGVFIKELNEQLRISGNILSLAEEDRERIKNEKIAILDILKRTGAHGSTAGRIDPAAVRDSYPLSSSQKRIWVLSQFEDGNIAYNIPAAYVFEGRLNIPALQYSFMELIKRHEILRTIFRENDDGDIQQYILAPEKSGFSLACLELEDQRKDARIKDLIKEEFTKPFDLAGGPLLRASLYRWTDTKWIFTYVMHHVVSDARSMDILVGELLLFYNSYVQGEEIHLPPLRIQYKDYAVWQQGQLSSNRLSADKAFWERRLQGELPVLSLLGDRPRPAVKTYHGGAINRPIGRVRSSGLSAVVKEESCTLFMGLLALINTFLYRYTGQDDIIIGSSIDGREQEGLEGQIGFYLNMLALRNQFKGTDSFRKLLREVRQATMQAFDHKSYPFDELIDQLGFSRDRSRNALFDVIVGLENKEEMNGMQYPGGITAALYEEGEELFRFSKFDLAFIFIGQEENLDISLGYNSDIFQEATVVRMAEHLERLLDAVIADPDAPICDLDYLSPEEKETLLNGFNTSSLSYRKDKTIVDLFSEQVERSPESHAVTCKDRSITYADLDEMTERLAAALRKDYQVGENDIVGIMLERSEKTLISILGILKAGAAYVAIDPENPRARKKFLMDDTGIRVLITTSDHILDLDFFSGNAFAIDVQLDTIAIPAGYSPPAVLPDNLAYIVYTSGSTGEPKGVMIKHSSLTDYVFGLLERTNLSSCKSFGLVSTAAADLGNTVIYGCLATGGNLHIFPERDILDPEIMLNTRVDCLKIVPSHWKALKNHRGILTPNKCLIFGGEQLTRDIIRWLQSVKGGFEVFNHYGPSETTIGKLIRRIDLDAPEPEISLGAPFGNTRIYILDQRNNPLPVGVAGEICIAGEGLAAGYLNRPEATEEKFVPDPFREGRMYKTGDVGRWLPGGTVEFLGRKDGQLKIRGYRIETGEIERRLRSHPGIIDAFVTAVKGSDGEMELAAYIVSGVVLDAAGVQAFLNKELPVYMVPGRFVCLDALPLNSNGKIDRRRLQEMEGENLDARSEFIPPRNATEEALAEIWKEVLGRERVGVKDDFFSLGGHSLKAARLASLIQRRFHVRIEFHELFTRSVLEEQARYIDHGGEKIFKAISPAEPSPDYPLSSSQRRLWILSRYEQGNVAYNGPGIYTFTGWLDRNALEYALKALVKRHEILRTVFGTNESGEPRQIVYPAGQSSFFLDYIDLQLEGNKEGLLELLIRKEIMHPFNLETGPLLRAALYQLEEDKWVFFYNMHHIISDGWSKNILVKELFAFYQGYVSGEEPSIKPLHIQYKDFSVWQQQELKKESFQRHKDYWLEQLRGELPVLQLAGDKPRPSVRTLNGGVVYKSIGAALTRDLDAFCRRQDATLFMGLLALVNALLYRCTGQNDIIIGSPVAGRDHAGLEDQIGFYINTITLRSRFDGGSGFRSLLEYTRDMTLSAFEHREYPFDELVQDLNIQRDISRNPVFDVWMVLNNFSDNETAAGHVFPEGLDVAEYRMQDFVISRFDLLFSFAQKDGELLAGLEYNADVFERGTAERLIEYMVQLLEAVIQQPDVPLKDVDFLTLEEKRLLSSNGNEVRMDYPRDRTVAQLFEATAAANPDEPALVFDTGSLTYRQLNERANRLAWYLRKKYQISANDLVGIKLDRNEWMIIAILAVLKSGGAYVPIDPGYPAGRISYMLSDSQSKALIDAMELDIFMEEEIDGGTDNPPGITTTEDLAYVIYTSGSTGQPKGVMISNRSLVDYIYGVLERTNMRECKSFGLVSTIAADLGNTVVFPSLIIGGELHIFSESDRLNAAKLSKRRLDCLKIVPSHWKALQGEGEAFLPAKCLIFGGEQLTRDVLEKIGRQAACHVYNHYGPSETTIGKLVRKIDTTDPGFKITIGTPIGNTWVYILDGSGNLSPMGVAGEICIGGEGVAKGYLHAPELTAQKFVQDPYRASQRMYRTGDLGRLLPDGNIEFIGRKDDQIKIRGFRIELGEIESHLLQYEKILSAVVLAKEGVGEDKQLVAYYTGSEQLRPQDIRDFISARLPSYMVPASYVQLEKIPLTSNGKVDKRALPLPEDGAAPDQRMHIPPRTEMEERLAAIWSDVLEIEKANIGVRDSFFDLGGHSLKAIRIMTRIYEQFDIEIDLTDLFRQPYIESLAEEVENILWLKQLNS